MDYPNVDNLFDQELENNNDIIAIADSLKDALTVVLKYGLDINDLFSTVLGFMQRKEYDNAAKALSDVVYSIEKLVNELGDISLSVKQGVLKIYEQESKGR